MMRDEAYKAICKSLNCHTGCCNGDTNIMVCGHVEDCLEYIRFATNWLIIMVTIFGGAGFFILWGIVYKCKKGSTCCESLLITCCIVFPPLLVVIFIRFIIISIRGQIRYCYI
jgi:hypothetical protein